MTLTRLLLSRVARSSLGARSRLGMLAVSLALLATVPRDAAARIDRGEAPLELPWRTGGRVGFTVDAASFPDSSSLTLEVYVRIPPSTLASLARDSVGTGRLAVSVQLRLPTGARLPESRRELDFTPTDTLAGFGKVIVMRYPTRPGTHRLKVRLEDVQSSKLGLLYFGRNAHEAAELEGEFLVPKPQADRDLSDIEFVWAEPDTGLGTFRRAGHTLLPNPERLYGLYASDLRAFFVARSRAGDERPWHWVARLIDEGGAAVAAQESTGAAGRWLTGACTFDLSPHAAGGYHLELKAWQEGDAVALTRRARFSIAWQPTTWWRNPREVEDDVHLLFDADAEERFARLQPGEQERALDEFWKRRDPTPETAMNEALETFHARVEQADRLYSRRGLMRGMFSDMGRVFIRYGEPTEVSHQVIPAGDETLLQVLDDIELSGGRPTGDVHQKGLGGDQRSFEVWTYEAPVPPPIDADPEAGAVQRHKRLLFLFVDEQGLGDFTLRYTTE